MIKPDGRLTHDLSSDDRPPRDACGVFGVWTHGEDVAKLAYFGLYALQHRGQESAGIAVSDGTRIVVFKDMGLVAQVFNESVLNTLRGHIAVGHCRYSTTGSSVWENAQPTFRATPSVSLALGHNGNLINTRELAAMAGTPRGSRHGHLGHRRADVAVRLGNRRWPPGRRRAGTSIEENALAVLPHVQGAFSLVFMDAGTLYAARDPQGFRPLVLGRMAPAAGSSRARPPRSTSSARRWCREIEPGELIAIDERGVQVAHGSRPPRPRGCLFEYVYLAGPTPRSAAAACKRPGWRSAGGWPPSTRSRRTW